MIPGFGKSTGEGIGYPLQYSWASLVAQLVKKKIHLQCGRPGSDPWVRKIPCRRERLPIPVFWPGEFHRLYNDSVTFTFTFIRGLQRRDCLTTWAIAEVFLENIIYFSSVQMKANTLPYQKTTPSIKSMFEFCWGNK